MVAKRGIGSNCFDNDLLNSIYNDYENCVWCQINGQISSMADVFDHVISRKNKYTDSIINASPTHNHKCNIGQHGQMHTRENQERMIKHNLKRLNREGYKLNENDLLFLQEYDLLELAKSVILKQ